MVTLPRMTQCRASGKSRISAKEVTDLPDPDSPTSASVSPPWMSKSMPCTTGSSRRPPLKLIDRLRTDRTGSFEGDAVVMDLASPI